MEHIMLFEKFIQKEDRVNFTPDEATKIVNAVGVRSKVRLSNRLKSESFSKSKQKGFEYDFTRKLDPNEIFFYRNTTGYPSGYCYLSIIKGNTYNVWYKTNSTRDIDPSTKDYKVVDSNFETLEETINYLKTIQN